MHDHLRIGVGGERVAPLLQLPAQRLEVVDLAVHGYGDPAGLVADRLGAAGQIDDRQPAKAERDLPGIDQPPVVIRASVRDRVAHPGERVVAEIRGSRPSGDAAHRPQETSEA